MKSVKKKLDLIKSFEMQFFMNYFDFKVDIRMNDLILTQT